MRWQDLISFGDDFTIKNDAGDEVYQVDGKAFTLVREKLSFEDMAGKELALIRSKILALTDSYEIVRDGEVMAVVKTAAQESPETTSRRSRSKARPSGWPAAKAASSGRRD